MTNHELPKWVQEAIAEKYSDEPAGIFVSTYRAAEFGARLVLERLAATAENDWVHRLDHADPDQQYGVLSRAEDEVRASVRREVEEGL